MSAHRRHVLRALVAGAALFASPALAVPNSSCPAPCAKPPRYSIFVREPDGHMNANGYLIPLSGGLLKGSARTVVRVDATVTLNRSGGPASLYVWAILNGTDPEPGYDGHGTACADTHPYCTMSMSVWFDIDALEAAHPGMFVGKPLNVMVGGGALTGSVGGDPYWATFEAQVVKK